MLSRLYVIAAASLMLCFSVMVNAELKNENSEHWRLYFDESSKLPVLRAMTYSFDGEDAALAVRCEGKQPELYFIFSDLMPTNVDAVLKFKVDGAMVETGKWQRSSNGNGAFAVKPLTLISQLANKQGLIVTYQNKRGEHKVAAFYLAGINSVVEKLDSVCQIQL